MAKLVSKCHLADVMNSGSFSFFADCSFCGKRCETIEMPSGVGYDVELTLRRWKENDCSTKEMLERLSTEYERIFNSVAIPTKAVLTRNKEPKFIYSPNMLDFVPFAKKEKE